MALLDRLRETLRRPVGEPRLAAWAQPLFASPLTPELRGRKGRVLVWTIEGATSEARVTRQFTEDAGEYHRRYANAPHFESLFRQALQATGVTVADQPLILDLGSGSGANSIVPCQTLFPKARYVATDLSPELLEMLARYADQANLRDSIVCVVMDAMSDHIAPGQFDLVTGASILHHLDHPEQGLAAAARALKAGGHALFFEPFQGWGLVRLAYERILAEGALRGDLDPAAADALNRIVVDIAARTNPDRALFPYLDDKWVFGTSTMEAMAREAGFSSAIIVPHNDHPTLLRDVTDVNLRFGADAPLALPDWAHAILDGFDAALPPEAKRALPIEGTIVLTK